MSLNVTIPDTFNGPLDLLLHLIRRDEMDIYDIPVSRLTNSYLAELEKPGVINVDEGAEFLDLASRLLEIKSRMLVPADEPEESGEEEEDDFDPRSGLVEALLEYRRFKDAAKLLGDMAEEQSRRYPRVSPRMEFDLSPERAAAGSDDLMRAFRNLLDRMLSVISDHPDVITYTEVSIATRAEQIVENLGAVGKTRFSRLLSDKPSKSEMVGLFIAMLELVRLGKIVARQSGNFSDIVIERREAPAVPPERGGGRGGLAAPVSFFPAIARESGRRADSRARERVAAPPVFPAAPPAPPSRHKRSAARPGAPFGLFPAMKMKKKVKR